VQRPRDCVLGQVAEAENCWMKGRLSMNRMTRFGGSKSPICVYRRNITVTVCQNRFPPDGSSKKEGQGSITAMYGGVFIKNLEAFTLTMDTGSNELPSSSSRLVMKCFRQGRGRLGCEQETSTVIVGDVSMP